MAPQADEQAGEPEFDYLLGITAIDSGHASDAVTALERVLAADPSNNGARMELARAYYVLGADDLAKREFNQLLALKTHLTSPARYYQYLEALELKTEKSLNQMHLSRLVLATTATSQRSPMISPLAHNKPTIFHSCPLMVMPPYAVAAFTL